MVLLLDGGDNLSGGRLQDSIKAEYYYRGLQELGYSACGLGELDLELGQDFLLDLCKRRGLDLVCANLHDSQTGELFAKPYTIQRVGARKVLGLPTGGVRVGITSVMRLEDETKITPKKEGDRELITKDPLVALRSTVQEMRGKTDVIICLAHTGMDVAKELARGVGGVDVMLVGHGNERNKEPVYVGKTCLIQPGDQGRMLAVLEAKVSPQKKVSGVVGTLVALTDTYPDDESMLALVKEYRETIRDANIIPEWPEMDKEMFLGNETCMGCHTEEHAQWGTTRHALAWETMEKEGVDTDPECVPCHVTGFGRWNGFRHKDMTPALVDVGCEMCHGPGKAHYTLITEGGDRSAVAYHALEPITPRTCTQCHRDHHDPEFNYNKDIFLVAHRPDELREKLKDIFQATPRGDEAASRGDAHDPAGTHE